MSDHWCVSTIVPFGHGLTLRATVSVLFSDQSQIRQLFVQLLRFAETGNAPPSLPNPLNIFEKLNQSVGAATEKPFVLLVFFVSVLVTFPTKEFASVIEFTVAGVVSLPFM